MRFSTASLALVAILSSSSATAAQAPAGAVLWDTYEADRDLGVTFRSSVVADPARNLVYVGGSMLVAYDATTGARRWIAREAKRTPLLSPSGDRLYAAHDDHAVAGFDPVSGAIVWLPDVAGECCGYPLSSVDGSIVFVVTEEFDGANQWVEISAYDASSGARASTARHGPFDYVVIKSTAISPDGERIFVVAAAVTNGTGFRIVAAVDSATGSLSWEARSSGYDDGFSPGPQLLSSPDGFAVYVGRTEDECRFRVTAYNSRTGKVLWEAAASPSDPEAPFSEFYCSGVAAATISPNGRLVYATGSLQRDTVTVAFDAYSGDVVWTARWDSGGGEDLPMTLVVTPDGERLFVASMSGADYVVTAYDARNGAQKWMVEYSTDEDPDDILCCHGWDSPSAVAVHPRNEIVLVTGSTATVAIGTGRCGPSRYEDGVASTLVDAAARAGGSSTAEAGALNCEHVASRGL